MEHFLNFIRCSISATSLKLTEVARPVVVYFPRGFQFQMQSMFLARFTDITDIINHKLKNKSSG